jgi:YesN/AraC family two-component response regulator
MNPFLLTLQTYNLNVEIHRHSAYQIVYISNNPFHSVIDNVENKDIFGFIIKPHVSHLCTADNSILNIINIEPYSSIGFYVESKFLQNTKSIVFYTQGDIASFFQIADVNVNDNINPLMENLAAKITIEHYDERVNKIMDYIKANYHKQNITPQVFADLIFLSPSRLASLFKLQTGSSLSKYLLWTRLRHAIYLSLSDKHR